MGFERALTLVYMFLPVILGGITNMVFMKLPVLRLLRVPMDAGRTLGDGKRIFGDNKTWKGFLGMVMGTMLWSGLLFWVTQASPLLSSWTLVPQAERHPWLEGLLMGLGYALAELPNSFIKRRVGIAPGTNAKRVRGMLFLVGDQADSAVGSALAMMLVLPLSLSDFVFLVLFGTVLHYVLNVALYFAGLRKQAA